MSVEQQTLEHLLRLREYAKTTAEVYEVSRPVACVYCKHDFERILIRDTSARWLGQVCLGCGGPYQLPVTGATDA